MFCLVLHSKLKKQHPKNLMSLVWVGVSIKPVSIKNLPLPDINYGNYLKQKLFLETNMTTTKPKIISTIVFSFKMSDYNLLAFDFKYW